MACTVLLHIDGKMAQQWQRRLYRTDHGDKRRSGDEGGVPVPEPGLQLGAKDDREDQ